jgi:hypothetical protein
MEAVSRRKDNVLYGLKKSELGFKLEPREGVLSEKGRATFGGQFKIAAFFMVKILLTLVFIGGFYGVYAQNEEDLSLIRVECWSPVEGVDNWVRIKEDGLSNIEISGASKTKVWMVDNDGIVIKKPAAYVSGSTPRIGACFRQTGSNNFCTSSNGSPAAVDYFVKGEVLDQNGQLLGMSLPAKQLVKTGSKKTYEYLAESTNNAFTAEEVRYFEEFKVKWQWSKDLNGPWKDAGTSVNRLYVTHKKPIGKAVLPPPYFYTCLHLGCTLANTKNTENEIFDMVFAKFSTKCVSKVDEDASNCLNYWENQATVLSQGSGVDHLLESGDGRCGDWVELLQAILYIQGFSGKNIPAVAYNPVNQRLGIFQNSLETEFLASAEQFFGNDLFPTPTPPGNPTNILIDNGSLFGGALPGSGCRLILHASKVNGANGEELGVISQFFVKSWSFSQGEDYYYALLPTGLPLEIKNPGGNIIETIYGADEEGKGGQGFEDPISIFGDHELFKFNNKFYDPSYGKGPFLTKNEWVDVNLAGYGTVLTYIGADSFRYQILWLHQKTSAINYNTIFFFD